MADTKISALTSGNPAQSGDEIPIARAGANYKITAGSIASLATVSPAGSDTYVQFNDGGAFGAEAGFAYNKTTNTLSSEKLALGTAGAAAGVLTLSGSTSGTVTLQPAAAAGTYTLTLPTSDGASGEVLTTDGSGVLSWAASAGGSPGGSSGQLQYNNAGAFGGTSGITTTGTELTIASGTKTASAPVLDITQTWNNAAVTFTSLKANVTDTASNAASLLMDLQVNGNSLLAVTKSGGLKFSGSGNFGLDASSSSSANCSVVITAKGSTGGVTLSGQNLILGTQAQLYGDRLIVQSTQAFAWSNGAITGNTANHDVVLFRDAAGILAQRNGTNAQTLRVYNTYTDASNYERAKIAWDTNVLKIGTEKAGTGTARALELQTDGTTRQRILSDGTEVRWFLQSGREVYIDNNANIQFTNAGSGLISTGGVHAGIFYSLSYGSSSAGSNNTVTYRGVRGSDTLTLGSYLQVAGNTSTNNGAFLLSGGSHTTDRALSVSRIVGSTAFATATTNISGGAVEVVGGAGAASSAGAAHGGAINLDGGQGYGTGVHGNVVVGSTRGALVTASKTYATLPTAAEGARSFVSDWTGASTFGTQVTGGGGSTKVPVWSDGTNWYVG